MMEIIAFIVTIFAGLIGEVLVNTFNWFGGGAVFAIATMGVFVMLSNRKKQKLPEERKNDSGEQSQQGEQDFANEQDIEDSEASNDQEG